MAWFSAASCEAAADLHSFSHIHGLLKARHIL